MLKENSLMRELKAEIGDWSFFNDDKDMFLAYPVKSNFSGDIIANIVHLQIHKTGEVDSRPLSWEWNGDKESPTITPSINVIGEWHGFLTDGKIVTV